tara:strand:- start:1409 stop:1621 length:213 start_codon:yes stop_codon:yes gene_type:complete
MTEETMLAHLCTVECSDGSMVENARIFYDGENLIYRNADNETIEGVKTHGAEIVNEPSNLSLIFYKERTR